MSKNEKSSIIEKDIGCLIENETFPSLIRDFINFVYEKDGNKLYLHKILLLYLFDIL